MEFYLVTTKCGHVGKTAYVPITFPIIANNGKEAARIARWLPRVKHCHRDAILECKRVDKEQFELQKEINNQDPYLKVKSKQEQQMLVTNLSERIQIDKHQEELSKPKQKSSKPNLRFQKMKYKNIYEEYECEYAFAY